MRAPLGPSREGRLRWGGGEGTELLLLVVKPFDMAGIAGIVDIGDPKKAVAATASLLAPPLADVKVIVKNGHHSELS